MQQDCFERDKAIYERFYNFHKEHPQIYQKFEEIALVLIRKGWKRFGAKAIVEKIRWEERVEKVGGIDFYINNDFVSRMARMFSMKYPQHSEFFQQRKLRS